MPRSKSPVQATPATPDWIVDATRELPPICTLAEVAAFLRVSTRSVRRFVAIGRIRSLKAFESGGSHVTFSRADVGRYLETLVAS